MSPPTRDQIARAIENAWEANPSMLVRPSWLAAEAVLALLAEHRPPLEVLRRVVEAAWADPLDADREADLILAGLAAEGLSIVAPGQGVLLDGTHVQLQPAGFFRFVPPDECDDGVVGVVRSKYSGREDASDVPLWRAVPVDNPEPESET